MLLQFFKVYFETHNINIPNDCLLASALLFLGMMSCILPLTLQPKMDQEDNNVHLFDMISIDSITTGTNTRRTVCFSLNGPKNFKL